MSLAVVSAGAITYTYDKLNKSKKTCRITGWSGTEPTSGKLTLKSSYTVDGVTYTVTSIAPEALNNLTGVTQITIPASITTIGDINAVDPKIGAEKGSLRNFRYCVRLQKFIVEDGNTVFTANADGWLMSKDGRNLYRVPSAGKYTDGALKMSNYIYYIYADAFVGNSNVKKVTLSSGLKAFYPSCGLTKLTNVTEYVVGSSLATAVSVNDGVLFNSSKSVLYAYPPKKEGEKYTVPATVRVIAEYAFAHNRTLRTVNYSSVRKIWESAFEDATYLYTVEGPAPESVSRRAFYNAMNLSSFPFSGSTALAGDSIFYGNGFGQVRFDDDIYVSTTAANRYTFSDERLATLDMGKIVFGSDSESDVYPFYSDFASGCTKLVNVTLPKRCIFKKDKGRPAFSGPFNLLNIVTGSFRVEGGNVPFVFPTYNTTSNTLRIFTATNSSTADIDKYTEWAELISITGHGGLSPFIYTDIKAPYAPDAQSKYVYRNSTSYATYYVPGLCAKNYKEAADEYCPVHEMYDIQVITQNGIAVVRLKANYDFLRMARMIVNDAETVQIHGDGDYDTGLTIDNLQSIRIVYAVNITSPYFYGPSMSTTYTRQDFGLSGIDDAIVESDDTSVEYYDLRGIPVNEPDRGVYIRRQGNRITKMIK